MGDKEKERIEEYLKTKGIEKVENWTALNAYIMKQAKECLKGVNGYVDDQTVFNWAFDFFHDGHADEAKLKDEILNHDGKYTPVEEKPKELQPIWQAPKPTKSNKNKESEGQISLW